MRAASIGASSVAQGAAAAGPRVIAQPKAFVPARRAVKAAATSTNKGGTRVQTAGNDAKGPPAKKAGIRAVLGFTETNELFLGRLAMLGFSSSIVGEVLTGKGALAQLGMETGVPVFELDWAILGLVGFNLVAALLPTRGRSDEAAPAALPSVDGLDWRRVFGVKRFGFTKENEIYVGRCAQLGFAASLLGEALTGKGILGQFDAETGLPYAETPVLLAAFIVLSLVIAFTSRKSDSE